MLLMSILVLKDAPASLRPFTKEDSTLRDSAQISFARMATFWGQEIAAKGLKKLSITGIDWEKNWAITKTHNHARMTRLLKHFSSIGLKETYKVLRKYLDDATARYSLPDGMRKAYKTFWQPVVCNEGF